MHRENVSRPLGDGSRTNVDMSDALDVCIGSVPGASMNVRAAVSLELVKDATRLRGEVPAGWARVVVRTTGEGGRKRAWVLVPASEANAIAHVELYVRGRFEITEQSNNARRA